MKKETLIKVIDEEFGDGYPLSWIVDAFYRAIVSNDRKVKMTTDSYERQVSLVRETLHKLSKDVAELEKEEKNKFEIKKARGK